MGRRLDEMLAKMAYAHARRGRKRRQRHEPKGLIDPVPRPDRKRLINPMADPYASARPRVPPDWRGGHGWSADHGWGAARHPPSSKRERYPMEFAPVDVIEIRSKFHASQRQFARMIGISFRTLRNWEQGKRRPQGPARALLRVAAANPNLVAATLLKYRRVWWMRW